MLTARRYLVEHLIQLPHFTVNETVAQRVQVAYLRSDSHQVIDLRLSLMLRLWLWAEFASGALCAKESVHHPGCQHWVVMLLGQCKFSLQLRQEDAIDEPPLKKKTNPKLTNKNNICLLKIQAACLQTLKSTPSQSSSAHSPGVAT